MTGFPILYTTHRSINNRRIHTMALRVSEMLKGDGPRIIDTFNRGDSWVVLDGDHIRCEGRQSVIGAGTHPDTTTGILMRCSGCLGSYVVTVS